MGGSEQAPASSTPPASAGDGAVTITLSSDAVRKPEPPAVVVDPAEAAEAALRARYGGLLPKKKKGPHGSSNALHQHFDSADWSMAKARGGKGEGGGGGGNGNNNDGSSSSYSSSLLSVSSSELAPPKLAPEPPAPRRPSHLGEASK